MLNPEQFYRFRDERREVEFLRPDPPSPWINYLSNGSFHAMLSQAGGGLAFYKSPQIWRISRYRFFHLPTDRPGPYLYIQDAETGEYWSPTSEPCATKPKEWRAAHGLGYSRFEAEHGGIGAELRYFVTPDENALVWQLRLANRSQQVRRLRIFAYVEFSMMEFMRELQWQCYNKHQVSVTPLGAADALVYRYGVEEQPKPDETPLVFFAADRVAGAFDGDRDEFIGSYRSESNPLGLERGCSGSTLLGGDPCGALQFDLKLEADGADELCVFLGTGMDGAAIAAALERLRRPGFVDAQFARMTDAWEAEMKAFQCRVPDPDVERMINTWTPYQSQRNFLFSRNISYYATGTFRGMGFRDTSQDVLARAPFSVDESEAKIRQLLEQQHADGHANHYFFPHEGWPPVTTVHSDDHLWPIMAVHAVVMESGEVDFLGEEVGYYDEGRATVYEHLRRAVEFTLSKLGPNGLPLMLRSDWNDQMFRVCREGRGESFWTAMQLGVVLPMLAELARLLGRDADAAEYEDLHATQQRLVNELGWDGRWFRRAIMDDGRPLGADMHEEAKIWLNAQSWSVMSGTADGSRGRDAMDAVREHLDTDLGVKLIWPPIETFPSPDDPLTNYNPGCGENGAVFCHANTWAIIAECMLGRGDTAFKYYRQLIPSVAMAKAGVWRYKAEPYVYASNLFGPESDKFGLANVSWLSGTAAWMYVAATQYILGVRPEWRGLRLDPCLPSAWDAVEIDREFRGCRYSIRIENRSGDGHGVKELHVDGETLDGGLIPHVPCRETTVVLVVL